MNPKPVVSLEDNATIRKEMVDIVLQWMIEQGFTAAAQVLREEAGTLQRGEHLTRKIITSMIRSIEEHNWESATKHLNRLQQFISTDNNNVRIAGELSYLNKVLPFLFAQQQFLELIGSDEDGLRAYSFFMKSVKPLEPLIEVEHFKKLNYLLTCKSVNEAGNFFPEYRSWSASIGCTQLISFINRTVGDSFVRCACITGYAVPSSSSLGTLTLENYLEDALSFRILNHKYPDIAEGIATTTITSLSMPLTQQIPTIDPFLSINIATLLQRDASDFSVTCCSMIAKCDFVVCGTSTGDLIMMSTSFMKEGFSAVLLPNHFRIFMFSEAVRGISVQERKILAWSNHKGILCDVQSPDYLAVSPQECILNTFEFNIDAYCGCLFPLATILCTGHSDGTVSVWDGVSGEKLYRNNFTSTPIITLVVNRTGTVIYSGAQDGVIRAVDSVTGILLFCMLPSISMELSALVLSPSSCQLLAAYKGGTLRLWDTLSGQEVSKRFSNTESSSKICISFGNVDNHLYCGLEDGTVLFWDLNSTNGSGSNIVPSDVAHVGHKVQYPTSKINLHRSVINTIQLVDGFLLSCGNDGCMCICRNQKKK